jgi:phage recombination protein Bet
MENTKEIVVDKTDDRYTYKSRDGQDVMLSPEAVRKHLVSGRHPVSATEVLMFMSICRYQQLNPFLKEAYLIKYSATEAASIVTARIVYEKRAAAHPQFAGIKSGVIVEKDDELTYRDGSFHLKGETIVGGWAEGHRKDQEIPRRTEISFTEYDANQSLWKSKPGTMIEKVAIVQCLRSMFPMEMQGLYSEEEQQKVIDVTPLQESPAGKDQKDVMRAKLEPEDSGTPQPEEVEDARKSKFLEPDLVTDEPEPEDPRQTELSQDWEHEPPSEGATVDPPGEELRLAPPTDEEIASSFGESMRAQKEKPKLDDSASGELGIF